MAECTSRLAWEKTSLLHQHRFDFNSCYAVTYSLHSVLYIFTELPDYKILKEDWLPILLCYSLVSNGCIVRRLHKVTNNLLTADARKCSILILLDLSTVFDIIDHIILLNHLNDWVGDTWMALDWFKLYFLDRTFTVNISDSSSSHADIILCATKFNFMSNSIFHIYASS